MILRSPFHGVQIHYTSLLPQEEGMKKVFKEHILPVLSKMEEKHSKKEGCKDHIIGDVSRTALYYFKCEIQLNPVYSTPA